jgi:hypothetical protein
VKFFGNKSRPSKGHYNGALKCYLISIVYSTFRMLVFKFMVISLIDKLRAIRPEQEDGTPHVLQSKNLYIVA